MALKTVLIVPSVQSLLQSSLFSLMSLSCLRFGTGCPFPHHTRLGKFSGVRAWLPLKFYVPVNEKPHNAPARLDVCPSLPACSQSCLRPAMRPQPLPSNPVWSLLIHRQMTWGGRPHALKATRTALSSWGQRQTTIQAIKLGGFVATTYKVTPYDDMVMKCRPLTTSPSSSLSRGKVEAACLLDALFPAEVACQEKPPGV